MTRRVPPAAVVRVALLGANAAALIALAFYARRTRALQREIAEMILLGVIIDPDVSARIR